MATTTYPAAVAALRQEIEAEWPHGSVPLVFLNENHVVPDTPSAFVLIEFTGGDDAVAGFGGGRGNNLWRQPGVVTVHACVPRGHGAALAEGYVEDALAILRGKRIGAVSCWGGSNLGGSGETDDGNYWRASGEIEFSFDRLG